MSHTQNKLLEQGFRRAQKITRRYASSFYLASRFLPLAQRKASYAIYAICRLSDEAVDAESYATKEKLKYISLMEQRIRAAYGIGVIKDPVLAAFRHTVRTHNIPLIYFDELIAGMRMDLCLSRYKTFDELYAYCYKVAGVVGLMMIHIFGFRDEKAKQHAIELGIAMQLTNILRDIKEDYSRGRIYIPQDILQQHNFSESMLGQGQYNENFRIVIHGLIARTRHYYHQSQSGIPLLTNRRCRMVTILMRELYKGILTRIEENACDVFSQRLYVPAARKTALLASVLLRGEYI